MTRHRRWRLPPDHPVIRAGHRLRDASLERDRAEEALHLSQKAGDLDLVRERARRLTLAMTDAAVAFQQWAQTVATVQTEEVTSGS